jgi:Peroxin-3
VCAAAAARRTAAHVKASASTMHHVHQACSFIRRHKRVIALAGVTAAAIAGVCKVRADLQTIAAMQAEQQARAAEERRFRLYIGRARSECRVAVLSFLPTLRRRLYTTVDIATPVRDLKLLRQSQQNVDAAADASEESDLAAAETALWDAVKVTGFTRLVLAMYSFSALNLMLRLQLHILGRHSYEEARQLLQQHAVAAAAAAARTHATATSSMHSTDPIDTAAVAVAAAAAGVGTALPMEARHAFLSATYEYLLGEGMVSLSETVTAAVQKCSAGWQCQTKAEVGCDELIAMLKRVRREVEGHQQHQTAQSGSVFSTNNTNSEQVSPHGTSKQKRFIFHDTCLVIFIIVPSLVCGVYSTNVALT